jgi:UPF0042 nucleotide-binding protein
MKNLSLVIITGLSGSGKSTAIDALEDTGYFCVDNMPVLLLPKFLELHQRSGSEIQKLALGMDLRQKEFLTHYREIFEQLRKEGYSLEVIFLEASEEVLVKRYSQTRRQHPVSRGKGLLESIRSEKDQLQGFKESADRTIDTSDLTVHQLKELIIRYTSQGIQSRRMRVAILSFGFKYGIPLEADLLVDVRFIPNPYFIPELKGLDGRDEPVKHYVTKWPETQGFLKRYVSLLEYLIPLYEKEGKSYLTIAIGCTGGLHRSVTISQEIYARIEKLNREIALTHRDIREGKEDGDQERTQA